MEPMGPYETQKLVDFIKILWPKCDWTPAVFRLVAERTKSIHLETEQVEAALGEVRATGNFQRSPAVNKVIQALKNAAASKASALPVREPESRPDPCPNVTDWNRDLVARYDADPEDPVFERMPVSVFVATRGMRGRAGGHADMEAAGLGHGVSIAPVSKHHGRALALAGSLGYVEQNKRVKDRGEDVRIAKAYADKLAKEIAVEQSARAAQKGQG